MILVAINNNCHPQKLGDNFGYNYAIMNFGPCIYFCYISDALFRSDTLFINFRLHTYFINFIFFQLKERDEKLGEAGELQRFLGNLDHFQQWLSRTQTTVASEDIPNSLSDAEKLLNQHQQLKDEIDAYAPEYAKMKEFGDKVTEGEEDPQYMFLRQVSQNQLNISIRGFLYINA